MKSKRVLPYIFILMMTACNLPGGMPSASQPPTIQPIFSPTITIPESKPTETPTQAPTQPPTQTPLPSDLPFTIDCSALPASRQADCDSFIAATRDQVYPIFREVTGVSLSKCYKSIHYIILPTDPGPGAGGISAGDTITYNQKYSIDLPHRYDVHELLHSISSCAGALDVHVFHGMILNYVYDRLGVHDPGYFDDRTSDNLTIGVELQLEAIKTASGQELANQCRGLLTRKTTIAYFDLGGQSVQSLYRSTIRPPEIVTAPNPKLVAVWVGYAEQVEALLETLEQDYGYSIDVPECGY